MRAIRPSMLVERDVGACAFQVVIGCGDGEAKVMQRLEPPWQRSLSYEGLMPYEVLGESDLFAGEKPLGRTGEWLATPHGMFAASAEPDGLRISVARFLRYSEPELPDIFVGRGLKLYEYTPMEFVLPTRQPVSWDARGVNGGRKVTHFGRLKSDPPDDSVLRGGAAPFGGDVLPA